ncbi:MAG: mannosyltransferase [Chitinophagales bacterium]
MQTNKLHIVSFDVPYPPDYGGIIDVYYKIKSLYEAGCEIYLHCFEYGRDHAAELEKYCKEVHYYKRITGIGGVSLSLPYIVYSRRNNGLLKRLQEMDAPILFEGIHTTYYLSHPSLRDRIKGIRTHNIEHEYYLKMAEREPDFMKKTYYKTEAALLKKYEASLHNANAFFALSLTDSEHFRKLYPGIKNCFVPPFHPYNAVNSKPGTGAYCLYHGNLSHPENREAVFFLLNEIIPNIEAQFTIAGKNPAEDLVSECNRLPNCSIISNPGKATMDGLVENAQIHVLPTFRQTGMKLKLLSALYGGRHVLVNEAMLSGTGLNALCNIADSKEKFVSKINELMQLPFTEQDKITRTEQLYPYNKANNANILLKAMEIIP